MNPAGKATPGKVVFLFTTFPVSSETFLQREMVVLRDTGLDFRIVSLWGGHESWNGIALNKAGLGTALCGILWIPYYLLKKPTTFLRFLKAVWRPRSSGLLNWGENLLGAGYALRKAGHWKREGVTHFHGVWASAPAMAAWFLSELTAIPFSFSGHAYDLFEMGGDGWLQGKMRAAQWMRTSTHAGAARFLELGADPERILVVRRGLVDLPPSPHKPEITKPVRFVSVGRMVEKMGYQRQIPLIRELVGRGMSLTVDWIGDGPEKNALQRAVRSAGLGDVITIHGYMPYAEVEKAYLMADCFLFTGQIDRHGDRAGLPNVVAEAMAWGLLVFSTRVGAVEEAVRHRETGILWDADPLADVVLQALDDRDLVAACRKNARLWIENKFDLRRNLGPLLERLSDATFQA